MTNTEKIGVILRRQLTISKLSQQKFADEFHTDLSSVKRWLKGECITFGLVDDIEKFFNIKIIDILLKDVFYLGSFFELTLLKLCIV